MLHNVDVHVTPLTVTGCGGLSCALVLMRVSVSWLEHKSEFHFQFQDKGIPIPLSLKA